MGAQDKEYTNDDDDDNDAGNNRLKNINNNDINDDEKGSSGQIISLSSNGTTTTTTTDSQSRLPLNNDQHSTPTSEWTEVRRTSQSQRPRLNSRGAHPPAPDSTSADAVTSGGDGFAFYFDEELEPLRSQAAPLKYESSDESDNEIDDKEVSQILVVTQNPRVSTKRTLDRTGDYETRAKMSTVLAVAINDGLLYYEKDCGATTLRTTRMWRTMMTSATTPPLSLPRPASSRHLRRKPPSSLRTPLTPSDQPPPRLNIYNNTRRTKSYRPRLLQKDRSPCFRVLGFNAAFKNLNRRQRLPQAPLRSNRDIIPIIIIIIIITRAAPFLAPTLGSSRLSRPAPQHSLPGRPGSKRRVTDRTRRKSFTSGGFWIRNLTTEIDETRSNLWPNLPHLPKARHLRPRPLLNNSNTTRLRITSNSSCNNHNNIITASTAPPSASSSTFVSIGHASNLPPVCSSVPLTAQRKRLHSS